MHFDRRALNSHETFQIGPIKIFNYTVKITPMHAIVHVLVWGKVFEKALKCQSHNSIVESLND